VFFFMAFVFAFFYLRRSTPATTSIRPTPIRHGWAWRSCCACSLSGRSSWRAGHSMTARKALGPLAAGGGARPRAIVVQFIEYYNLRSAPATAVWRACSLLHRRVHAVLVRRGVLDRDALGTVVRSRRPRTRMVSPSRRRSCGRVPDACAVFLYVMVLVELFAFVLLYLVK